MLADNVGDIAFGGLLMALLRRRQNRALGAMVEAFKPLFGAAPGLPWLLVMILKCSGLRPAGAYSGFIATKIIIQNLTLGIDYEL